MPLQGTVTRAVIEGLAPTTHTVMLIIHADGEKHRIPLWGLVEEGAKPERRTWRDWVQATSTPLSEAPLLAALHARGIEPIEAFDANRPISKSARNLLFVALAGVLYFFLESFTRCEEYAAASPALLIGGIGLSAGIAAGAWIIRKEQRTSEAFVIGLAVTMGICMAAYPGLLRINALLDTEGLKSYEYTLREDQWLDPPQADMPAMEFLAAPEYWKQFPVGSRHEIWMRRGPLFGWQFAIDPIYSKMDKFYGREGFVWLR